MVEVFKEAFCDSINMVPFLFVTYLIIEYIEKYSSDRIKSLMTGFGRFGSFGGALLGCIPQCGISASAANLYSNKVITLGTIVAVFLSTSDEAIPMLISSPSHSGEIIKLIGIKVIVATVAGVLVDLIFKSTPDTDKREIHHKHGHCCGGENKSSIFLAAVKHTISTYVFVFVVSVALGGAITLMGEERISRILMTDNILQPFISALVGFIPNCASSVLLTQLYIEGTLSFGSVVSGLCTGAGIGLAVLFKENRHMKDNLKIMAITYAVAVIAGLLL